LVKVERFSLKFEFETDYLKPLDAKCGAKSTNILPKRSHKGAN